MWQRIENSWEITKQTFEVMKKDRELLLFPILAAVFSTILIAILIFPTIIASILSTGSTTFSLLEYLLVFITYFGLATIATFFNVCVVYTAKKRFNAQNATFKESIQFAVAHIDLIIKWALLSATIGLILYTLDKIGESFGQAGELLLDLVRSIMGLAWSLSTIFVIPAMVYHGLTPLAAIKRSIQTLKKTWGESVVRVLGLGAIQAIAIIITVVAGALFTILLGIIAGTIGIIIAISTTLILIVGLIMIFSVANTIFNTALYEYAASGKIPSTYSHETLHNAFRRK